MGCSASLTARSIRGSFTARGSTVAGAWCGRTDRSTRESEWRCFSSCPLRRCFVENLCLVYVSTVVPTSSTERKRARLCDFGPPGLSCHFPSFCYPCFHQPVQEKCPSVKHRLYNANCQHPPWGGVSLVCTALFSSRSVLLLDFSRIFPAFGMKVVFSWAPATPKVHVWLCFSCCRAAFHVVGRRNSDCCRSSLQVGS